MPQFTPHRVSRRQMLQNAACGFGSLALAGLCAQSQRSAWAASAGNPLAPKTPHLEPRAKRVIFIFMQGGPSNFDSYDQKPLQQKEDGKIAEHWDVYMDIPEIPEGHRGIF